MIVTIRGDRRGTYRNEPQRRSRPRTPGAFNDACDAAYQVMRKYEIGSTKTEVPLCESTK